MCDKNVLAQAWVQDLIKRLTDSVEKNTLEWCETVINVGLSEEERSRWVATFVEQVDFLFEDMNKDALSHQEKLEKNIEELLKKSEALCKELHMKMPPYGSQKLSLLDEQKLLLESIKRYEEIVEERRKELTQLDKQMKQLCSILGCKPKPVLTSPLPSEDYILKIQAYIASLEKEEYERHEKYTELKVEIQTIANELQYEPILDFERLILSENDDFSVTDENMELLEIFYKKLKEHLKEVRIEIASLQKKIKTLWEVIDEDRQKQGDFLEKHSQPNLDNLKALRREVKRCEAIKKANIEVFVNKFRQELLYYWDLCRVSQNERNSFIYFDNSLYTEDLLTLHDLEVEKWKKMYLENSSIFKLLEKWEQLWKRKVELEDPVEAPDRYKNRGGKLLREERERNILYKQIPKLEQQLQQMALEFLKKNGRPFLCDGKTIDVIISQNYEKYDNERKSKLSARKQQRDKSVTPCRSAYGLNPASSQINLAGSSCKRKLITPTAASSTKKSRLQIFASDKKGLRTAPPKLPCRKVEGGRSRYSIEKKKRIEKCRRRMSKTASSRESANGIKTANTTYEDFQKEMSNKGTCRSTDYHTVIQPPSPLAMPLPESPRPAQGFLKALSPQP